MPDQKVYFSNIENIIIEYLNSAENNVLIAVAWFTSFKLIKAVENCLKRGVDVKIIIYNDRINNIDLYDYIFSLGAKIVLSKKLMHNKFCIIDNSIVINGSFNWTVKANSNNENIIVFRNNSEIISDFSKHFYNLYKRCSPIETFGKHKATKVLKDYEEFENVYYKKIASSKFPYFYKITDTKICLQSSRINYLNFKIKTGYYLIKNKDIEKLFLLFLYLLEPEKDLYLTKSILNIDFNQIKTKYFPRIIEFDNTNSTINHFTNNKLTVIDQVEDNYIYKIDFNGDIVSAKLYYELTFPGDRFVISFEKSKSLYLVDYNFKIIKKLFEEHVYISKSLNKGILFCNYEQNNKGVKKRSLYGLMNYEGEIILKPLYNTYETDEKTNTINLFEFPILMNYHNGRITTFKPNIPNERLSNSLWWRRQQSFCRIVNISDYSISETKYPIHNDEYFYLSDNSEKYFEFYMGLCFYFKNKLDPDQFFSLDKYKIIQKQDLLNMRAKFEKKTWYIKDESERNRIALSIFKEFESTILERKKMEDFYRPIKNNNSNCFIATTAYQDINHPQVIFLRKYRDSILINHKAGRIFIDKYYIYSPKISKYLSKHRYLNKGVRILLDILICIIKYLI